MRLPRPAALPLRAKVVTTMVGSLLAALALTTLVTTAAMNRYLVTQADEELSQFAHVVTFLQLSNLRNEQETFPTNFSLRIIGPNGIQAVADSIAAPNEEPDLMGLTVARLESGEHVTVDSSEPPGTQWRIVGGTFAGTAYGYVVARPLDAIRSTASNVLWLTASVGLIAVLLSGGLGWYAVRRALRPVTDIEATAAAIAAGDRSRRIPEPTTDDEVASLSRSLNSMLGQIEQSLDRAESSEERMRRFVADASHELRTPLVAIRGYAELYRQGALPEKTDVAASMRRIEHEARRMGGLVEDLLMLARMDQDQPLTLQTTDLAVLAADAVADARAMAPDRTITLVGITGRVRPIELRADDRRIRQVLANLLANACRHTPPGTPIEVAIGKEVGGVAALEVRDHGPGIDPSKREAIFERFFRADGSRHRDTGGSGLGLAIVAAIVAAHRGRIRVLDTPGGGATFAVDLPTGGSYLPPRHHP